MRAEGASSLNPYAAAYVPLLYRVVPRLYRERGSAKEFEVGQFGRGPMNASPKDQHQNVSESHPQSPGATQTAEYSKWKDQGSSEFVASTSQYPKEIFEEPNIDDEFLDMDLAYLQMIFPEISKESLSDVYLANKCDLDFSVYMLNQLEHHPDDSSDKLPDTLDIGDVPESGCVKAPEEAKNATAGASTSDKN